jgi:hypothetical protein
LRHHEHGWLRQSQCAEQSRVSESFAFDAVAHFIVLRIFALTAGRGRQARWFEWFH